MTAFIHVFRMIPADSEQPPRLCRIDWMIVNKDQKVVRGFSFEIEPDNWLTDEATALIECGSSFDRLHAIGRPAKKVIQKFFDDLSGCDTMIALDIEATTRLLRFEAGIYQCGAKKKVENMKSLEGAEGFEFDFTKDGLQKMVDFYHSTQ